MSELKVYGFCSIGGDFLYQGTDRGSSSNETLHYYLKSEADKVIAELQKQVHDYAQGLYVMQARAEKESRHQKYKRCLAMAKICECRTAYTCGLRLQHNLIWRQRWLELAEKFKPVKETDK